MIGEDDEAPVTNDHSLIDSKKKEEIEIVEIKGDEAQDAWAVEDDKVVRYHRVPRDTLFSPCDGNCPIPVEMLSNERFSDLLTNEEPVQLVSYRDDWTLGNHSLPETLSDPWVGATTFTIVSSPQRGRSGDTRPNEPIVEAHLDPTRS